MRHLGIPSVLATILILAGGPAGADEPFGSERSIDSAFDGATSVATADFDRDGDVDVAATARWDGQVSWWETPDGTEHVIATGFDEAHHLVAADIDGDGWVDLVGAKRGAGSGDVTWWKNPGAAGGAWVGTDVSGGYLDGALAVAVGDVTNDGNPDIVAAGFKNGFSDGIVMFFPATGSASFPTGCDVDIAFPVAHAVAVADLEGMGYADLVAASYDTDEVVWYDRAGHYCNPSSWIKHVISTSLDGPVDVGAADVDSDGDRDVVVAAYDSGRMGWYENTAGDASAWSAHFPWPLGGAYEIQVVDLDRDGDHDVVGAGRLADEVSWWERQGLNWIRHDLSETFDGARSVAIADLDRDGDLDVAAAGDFGDSVSWWENEATARTAKFRAPTTLCSGLGSLDFRDVVQVDLDDDGDLDFLATVADTGSGADVVYGEVEDGIATCDVLATDLPGAGPITVHGQGRENESGPELRLYVAAPAADTIRVFDPFVGGETGELLFSDWDLDTIESPADVAVLDVDDDHFLEYAAVTPTGLFLWDYEGYSGEWVQIAAGSGGVAVATADLDRDGDPDLVAAWGGDDRLRWYENTAGDGSSWSAQLGVPVPGIRDVEVGDLDGDGWLDLVATAHDDDSVVWYENLGPSGGLLLWTPRSLPSNTTTVSPEALELADIDRDGDLDVISASPTNGNAFWWRNRDGDARHWVIHPMAVHQPGIRGVGLGDRTLDGYHDVLLAVGAPTRSLSWADNRGGQATFLVGSKAPSSLGDAETVPIFGFVPLHLGRLDDVSLEVRHVNLLIDDGSGHPLTTLETGRIVDTLELYLDSNDSGALEPGSDTLLASDPSPYVAAGGKIRLDVLPGAANPGISPVAFETFFVALRTTADATSQVPDRFRLGFVHDGRRPLWYEDHPSVDSRAEYFSTIRTPTIFIGGIFADDFETGDTSAWE